MMGNILSSNGRKSSYKASFLGKNGKDPKSKYADRNCTYSSVYNMSFTPGKQSVPKQIEPKLMNFDTVVAL